MSQRHAATRFSLVGPEISRFYRLHSNAVMSPEAAKKS